MRLIFGLVLALFVALVFGLGQNAATDRTYEHVYSLMKEEFGEEPPVDINSPEIHNIEARDGVKLRTRVWIPRDYEPGQKRSVVLDRTPYGMVYSAMSLIWAVDGYIIVMQDQRGTGGSGGNFEIWRYDGQDAYDTCEWISQQEWSNGKVFTFGVSADGVSVYTQILYDNPWLKAQFPVFGVANGHELVYPGGVYLKNLVENWLEGLCDECIPLVKENEKDGPFWDSVNMTTHYGNVKFPSIHWGGWYDIFLQGQIDAYEGYKKQGQPEAQQDTYLFIEPHGHCYDVLFLRGISLLGLRLGRKIYQLADTGVRDPLLDEVKALTLFVMGPLNDGLLSPGNFYTSLEEWPTPVYTDYFLNGERGLQGILPLNNTEVTFTSDPANPPQTYGGNNLFGTCGALDQAALETRSDLVTFTTDSLFRDTAVVGALKAVLFVSTTANDTDFLVKVTDVYPDGRSILITEGSYRMRWRGDKRADPQVVVPGEIYEIEIEIWSTAIIFARGHSIRVTVSSSNDPRYDPNPNNGNLLVNRGDNVIAQNTIHTGKSTPSRVILPVVEMEQIPEAKFFV